MVSTVTFAEGLEDELKDKGFELTPLKKDLENYFESNKRRKPHYLGKDVPFERPDEMWGAEVHHIHVFVKGISCPIEWRGRTSNSYLVYTFGDLDTDTYLVMDFISENAHEKCRGHQAYTLMRTYKFIADNFRTKF